METSSIQCFLNPILRWIWGQAQKLCVFLMTLTNNSETLKILMSQLYMLCIHIINLPYESSE